MPLTRNLYGVTDLLVTTQSTDTRATQTMVMERKKRREASRDAEFALFFDIDGVFHRPGSAQHSHDGTLLPTSKPLFTWAEPFLEIIKPYHNVTLVCHSMWRLMMTTGGIYSQLPELMQDRFLCTASGSTDRWKAIQQTAANWGFKEYIVLDDDHNAFPSPAPDHIVLVDSWSGMSDSVAQANLKHTMLQKFGPPPAPLPTK